MYMHSISLPTPLFFINYYNNESLAYSAGARPCRHCQFYGDKTWSLKTKAKLCENFRSGQFSSVQFSSVGTLTVFSATKEALCRIVIRASNYTILIDITFLHIQCSQITHSKTHVQQDD
jgi:hypothetical protein